MKLLLTYLRKHTTLVFFALTLAAINQVFSLLDPLVFRYVIDNYASKPQAYTPHDFLVGILTLLGAAVGVAFVSRTAKNFQEYYVNVITQRVGAKIYADGLAHSLELPYAVFEDQQSGETLGRLQRVRSDVEKLIIAGINTLFTTLVGFVFIVVYSVRTHWIIVPAYALATPLIGWVSAVLSKRIKTVQTRIVREATALSGTTTESLRNIELVKSLGLADQEIARLNSATDKILDLELQKVRYIRSLSFVQGTLINFIRTSILFLMLFLLYKQEITFGQFFSLYIYSFYLFGPLQELGTIIALYREAEVSLQNFANILATPVEPQPARPEVLGKLLKLEFSHVGFRYDQAAGSAINVVSFNVSAGETIAFVGPSGAGKSTLVKLLVGLYRPAAGAITCNGIPIDMIDTDHLRTQIGIVTQQTQLFADSIRENIRFVRPAATDAECLAVLEQAACGELLSRAQRGLDTMIGEGGVKVSGGERQRLSIARALLRNPRLLVFDEATSALDSLTEEEIARTIRKVSTAEQRITVLIAHRLATVIHADRIYVLERGAIVEEGSHEKLLEEKGLYYAMWRQQMGETPLPSSSAGATPGRPGIRTGAAA